MKIIINTLRKSYTYSIYEFKYLASDHFRHAFKTAADIVRSEGIFMLLTKFCTYYVLSIILLPYFILKVKRFKTTTPFSQVIDFVLANNLGVIQAGQIRSELLNFLGIAKKIKPRVIVEIGTANGGTLFALSKLLSADGVLISIDLPYGKFGGGYHIWKVPLYKSFASNEQKAYLLRLDSHAPATLNTLKQILGKRKIDLLFIDADHSYAGVKQDFNMYSPLVRKGGIIALHDIVKHTKLTDVHVDIFWHEIRSKYHSKEIIDKDNAGWGGIGIVYNYLLYETDP